MVSGLTLPNAGSLGFKHRMSGPIIALIAAMPSDLGSWFPAIHIAVQADKAVLRYDSNAALLKQFIIPIR